MYVDDIDDLDELKDLIVEVEGRIIRAQRTDARDQALEDYKDIEDRIHEIEGGMTCTEA